MPGSTIGASAGERAPLWVRLAVISGGAILSWAVVGVIAWALIR